ncbi:type II secretion system protein N [Vibrio sp. YMD68]|uniref:type II secretion system protein N n=1 Tax=Vibrio sp. YMD68 TaxID=3042300 RepID=UPI00249B0B12|nr:type II secretion system protein N [Vibrio sp. YMD68]WGW00456.1 type II secretion system protein N [Vibrio sp. YMD68]
MKRIILISLLLIVTLIVSLIVHMPAQYVLQAVSLPQGLVVQGTQGSIWKGSAERVSWQGTSLGQVNWTVNAAQLLMGKVQVTTRFGQGSEIGLRGRGVVGYGFSGAYAKDVIASVPAQFAIDQLSLPLPVDLEGQLEVSIIELEHAMPYCQSGTGTVVWSGNNATTPLAELALGSVVANIDCQDNVVSINAKQESEQVSAEFEGQLDAATNGQLTYSAKGWFKPEANFPTSLSSQLQWLGNPDSKGHYSLDFNGRL